MMMNTPHNYSIVKNEVVIIPKVKPILARNFGMIAGSS
jgi:hypothetical protein